MFEFSMNSPSHKEENKDMRGAFKKGVVCAVAS